MMKETKSLLLAAMLLLACSAQSRQSQTATQDGQTDQAETVAQQPPAKPVALKNCPKTDRQLRVALSRDADMNQVAVIYRNGDIVQSLNDEEPLFTDWYDQPAETFIHYVDANFDGHTDIFLGLGQSRTYSTLLLWNPKTQLFERYGNLGEPSLQNPVFAPAEKAIYSSGSNSAFEYVYTRDVWDEETLIETEVLYYYANPAEYNGMNGTNVKKYNIYGPGEQLVKATNDIKQLPKGWQQIINLTQQP
mgnify:CR=1 FL=1